MFVGPEPPEFRLTLNAVALLVPVAEALTTALGWIVMSMAPLIAKANIAALVVPAFA
jgi:hypothetical protein